ncbi:DoxX family protein [Actinotalea solisilvae]|uniref:DoxX family protein n=1 Tax=Actinotalea solisilvae TaxID=2072922 RepID=UPI0018F2614A|nr:hypothetical protein [Actinotalea solisilvae]
MTTSRRETASVAGLVGLLAAAGVTHLVRPALYDGLIPRALGAPRPWVLGSGVAELACAAAVTVPATRRLGALATAALFAVVLPGNVTMAVRMQRSRRPRTARRRVALAVAWLRLPLQVPLVLWALRVARRAA